VKSNDVLDDLVRRNRLLIATARHVRQDTLWLLHVMKTAAVRAKARAELRAIVERAARRRLCSQ
jgi:hypothetical protein